MHSEEKLPQDGVVLDSISTSPYDLPSNKWVEAQDPPVDEEVEEEIDVAVEEDESTEQGPSEEEMLDEIETSPGVQWKKYLQPILKIIKDTKLKVPIELHNSYTVGIDDDTSLGFHISGVVHFLGETPEDVADALQGAPLQYVATITPDGNIGDVNLIYPTSEEPYTPTYHINRNIF